jgi:hypothetical protein
MALSAENDFIAAFADLSEEKEDQSIADSFAKEFMRMFRLHIYIRVLELQYRHDDPNHNRDPPYTEEQEARISEIDRIYDAIMASASQYDITMPTFIKAVQRVRNSWTPPVGGIELAALRDLTTVKLWSQPQTICNILCAMLGDHEVHGWMTCDMSDALVGCIYSGIADLEAVVMKDAVAHEQHARVNDHCIPDLRNIVMGYLAE